MTAKTVKVDLPAEIFDVEVNIPLIHQVVVAQQAAARQGTHVHQDPRRGPRRWPQALQAEGHRPRPPGLDPRAAVRRRWRRPRPAAARLRPAHPQEDEGRRPARCPLRPGPQRPRSTSSSRLITGDKPSTKAALAALAALTDRTRFLVVLERTDTVTWLSLRNAAEVHLVAVDQLNTYDVLLSDDVVFTKGAYDAFVAGRQRQAGKAVDRRRDRGG